MPTSIATSVGRGFCGRGARPVAEDVGCTWMDRSLLNEDWQLVLAPVVEYLINSKSKVRFGYFHEFSALDGNEDRTAVLQFYYYGLGVG